MPRRVWIVWALFVVRGIFYCAMLPLWEGWDEYAHFAWLQHWIDKGSLPRRYDPISREIELSMQLAPLPHELNWIGPPYLTHDQWWALSPADRDERLRQLHSISPRLAHEPGVYPFVFYEAQQPPLYYWMASAPLRFVASWPIASRVLCIRLLGMALASSVIPLTWFAARDAVGPEIAIFSAAILAAAPGLIIDVSRVANDVPAPALVALLALLLIRREWNWAAAGGVLGAALLTKGSLLALIPAAAICSRGKNRRRVPAMFLTAAAIAGWWYGRNLASSHSFTGWMDEVSPRGMLAAIPRLNWFAAAQVSAKTFLWSGAWSFLTLKSWIYTVLEAFGILALIGCLRARSGLLRVPFSFTICFAAAMAYATLAIFVTAGVANAPGWYLWVAACPLAILFTAGARRLSIALVCAFALVDLYGANAVMLPYYAGLVARNRADLSRVPEALARLNVPLALWIAYIAATVAIPFVAFVSVRRTRPLSSPPLVNTDVIDIE